MLTWTLLRGMEARSRKFCETSKYCLVRERLKLNHNSRIRGTIIIEEENRKFSQGQNFAPFARHFNALPYNLYVFYRGRIMNETMKKRLNYCSFSVGSEHGVTRVRGGRKAIPLLRFANPSTSYAKCPSFKNYSERADICAFFHCFINSPPF